MENTMNYVKKHNVSVVTCVEHKPVKLLEDGGLDKNTRSLFYFFGVENPTKYFFKHKFYERTLRIFAFSWIAGYIFLLNRVDEVYFFTPMLMFLFCINLLIYRSNKNLLAYLRCLIDLKDKIGRVCDYTFFGEKRETFNELQDYLHNNGIVFKEERDLLVLLNIPDAKIIKGAIEARLFNCLAWATMAFILGVGRWVFTYNLAPTPLITFFTIVLIIPMIFVVMEFFVGSLTENSGEQKKLNLRKIHQDWHKETETF